MRSRLSFLYKSIEGFLSPDVERLKGNIQGGEKQKKGGEAYPWQSC
jgi:hypothetical protein